MNGSCLIGFTGLVGSNLLLQRSFEALYNSRNIEEIAGGVFKELVCSGAPGTKYIANLNPDRDLATINRLISYLKGVKTERFILISTIDVYGQISAGCDESYPIDSDETHSYGTHRRMLEKAVKEIFPDVYIFRLAGLFGKNIKKNLIFDLINEHRIEAIDHRSQYQWYFLDDLWADISLCIEKGLRLVNLVSEPLSTARIILELFSDRYKLLENGGVMSIGGSREVSQDIGPSIKYDVRTLYGEELVGGSYLYSANEVISKLRFFIKTQESIRSMLLA